MRGPVLELRGTAVSYDGREVLDIPSLDVQQGEVLSLLGENGSGKTTLLRLLGLLLRPARGVVRFGGDEVDFGSSPHLLALRRRTAGVMQEPLLCRMTVKRNVGLGLRFRGLPRPEVEARSERWLEKLGISGLGDRPASKLSGGEAQRASLARAMVLDPEVLFLDEPFGSLDAPTRQSLLGELRGVLAESGVTAVFATHDRGEALALGDRVAVMVEGRIAQIGPTEEVFSRPRTLRVARFVGIETLIPGEILSRTGSEATVESRVGRLVAPGGGEAGEEVWVAVRPEEMEIHLPGSREGVRRGAEGGQGNLLTGTVTRVLPGDTHYRVEVECGVRIVAAVSRARVREVGVAEGREVEVTFPAGAAHLIHRTEGQDPA